MTILTIGTVTVLYIYKINIIYRHNSYEGKKKYVVYHIGHTHLIIIFYLIITFVNTKRILVIDHLQYIDTFVLL